MRKTTGFMALLLAALLLFGCAVPGTDVTAQTDKTVTLEEYLAENRDGFTEAAERMQEEDLPRMRFFCQLVMDEIRDPELVADFWQRLCAVQIRPGDGEEKTILDADICFYFEWEDGVKVTVAFASSEYFNPGNGPLLPTEDAGEVRAIARDLMQAWEMQQEESAPVPQQADSADIALDVSGRYTRFDWDADGDGEAESFEGCFHDNGDEAPSVIKITAVIGGEEQAVWIDRAYAIVRATPKDDAEQGRYLELEYEIGDYYGHDNTAVCNLYLDESGTLTAAGEYL